MRSPKFMAWGILILIALIWGSSFILIKKGLIIFSPDELGSLRIVMAFLALLPTALVALRRVDKKKLPVLFVIGFSGSFMPAFLFALAETELASSLTGALNALTPIFVILVGALFFHQKVGLINAIGIGIGFMGTLFLMLGGSGFDLSGLNYHALYVVLATILYGINVNLIKHFVPDLRSLHITAISLFLTSPICVFYLLGYTNFMYKLQYTEGFWLAFLYISALGILGTAVALVMFNKLVKISGTIFASSVTYLIPIVAIVWGLLDGEQLGITHLTGIGIVIAGVYIANRK